MNKKNIENNKEVIINTLQEYQEQANMTIPDIKNQKECNNYLLLKFLEETGNLLEILNDKDLFDNVINNNKVNDILGDLLWYISSIATNNNLNLKTIAENNISKIRNRHGVKFNKSYYLQELK